MILNIVSTLLLCSVAIHSASADIRIGAFNVQTFGVTKLGKEHVMDRLTQIVKRYDVILIQEIRDASGVVIPTFLDLLKSDGTPFEVAVSERLGRSSYKEQYAYYYRPDRVKLEEVYQFDDGPDDGTDIFSREPFAALFSSALLGWNEFALIGIHVAPSDAVNEIDHLTSVIESVQEHWAIDDVLMMGDFNSDCSYVRSSDWHDISLRNDQRFTWLIEDNVDTTVSSTDCAYDRIVMTGQFLNEAYVDGSATEYRFDDVMGLSNAEAKEVSDHYPVEMLLSTSTSPENRNTAAVDVTDMIAVEDIQEILTLAQVESNSYESAFFSVTSMQSQAGEIEVEATLTTARPYESLMELWEVFPGLITNKILDEILHSLENILPWEIMYTTEYDVQLRCHTQSELCTVSIDIVKNS